MFLIAEHCQEYELRFVEESGLVVERRTLDPEVPGSNPGGGETQSVLSTFHYFGASTGCFQEAVIERD